MLDPNPRREEVSLLLPIVNSPAVRGRVLILGHSPFAVSAIANNPAVGVVFYCPGASVDLPNAMFDSPAARNKLTVAPPHANPWTLQRRDIGVDHVDFLFADLSREPWQIGREEGMKDRHHQFRPSVMAYRWQELDIAAAWIAAGCTLDEIDHRAFAVFAAQTGIMPPMTSLDYAKHCARAARAMCGAA